MQALGLNLIKVIGNDKITSVLHKNNFLGQGNLPPPQFGTNRAEVKSVVKRCTTRTCYPFSTQSNKILFNIDKTNKIFQYRLTMVRQKYVFVTGTKKIQFAPILPISILDVDDDEE